MSLWVDDNKSFMRKFPFGTLPTDTCQHPHEYEWQVEPHGHARTRNPCPECIKGSCAVFRAQFGYSEMRKEQRRLERIERGAKVKRVNRNEEAWCI